MSDHPIDILTSRLEIARRELMCAEYIDSANRRESELRHWQGTIDALISKWWDHDRSPICPVLPGTPLLVRHDPNAVKLSTRYPERLNWTLISKWKLHT